MTLELEDIIKVLFALFIGGVIGAEREYHDKAAGFRTLIFICVGAALFTIFSLDLGGDNNGVRIAAQIVSGVGFLGAGVVMRDSGRVTGLTTAAMIWLVAALGMGVGGGYYLFSLFTTGIILIVLIVFPMLEGRIDRMRDVRSYEIFCPLIPDRFEEIESLFADCGLHVRDRKRLKADEEMICTWHVYGTPQEHALVMKKLCAHPHVRQFKA